MKWTLYGVLSPVLFGLCLGCGKGEPSKGEDSGLDETEEPESAKPADSDRTPWDPSKGTATIRGVVRFEGEAPRRRPISMGGDAKCEAAHEEPVLDESAIVGPDGGLANVFVWVKRGLEKWEFTPPEEPAVIDQKGCMYIPHVQGIQVGQELLIRNSDPWLHNVHSLSKRNKAFNWSQPNAGMENRIRITAPEVMIKLKCDVHGWMATYLGAVPHPYFFVTKEDGKFELTKLPPGTYTLEAVHERFGRKTLEATVGDGETTAVQFSFSR